ncbi:MAG: Microtubule-associated protein, microtubule dynamics during spindle orientation [Cirrosporium novae-zelandiae]|nr:MAG: Microtubule-associated protein, microtubule dynamics during spindle orientation [Cirrosporium novae-zelandiae]
MAEAEEDFSAMPIADRFVHKNWKIRKSGYEDATKEFEKTPDESDPAFKPFLQDPNLWKGAVADSNVAAQADGLAAYCAFLKYGGVNACTRTRGITVGPICEKALASTRPAAKQSALEALLLCIELDKANPVVEDMIPFIAHKIPKTSSATLAALKAIYHAYGCKIVDPKPVLKALTKSFDHRDKNVRAEAQHLTIELYRWLRDGMKPLFWDDLKPVQQHDLDKLFEEAKSEPPPKQERLLRSQQEAAAAAAAAGVEEDEDADGAEEEEGGFDAFDALEPQDVFAKVPKDLHDNLSSAKWKDRKEALDGLFAALNSPKIKDGPFDEIVRALAKCMKDANVAVVTEAANCVDVLAKGLRKGFSKYRGVIMTPIMERCKEKKQSVADALSRALDAVFASSSLSDCLEDILEHLKHKNPQVKFETLKFLIRCLKTTRDVPPKPEVKSIADAATKLLTESNPGVREGGAEVLGVLMKILGERAMNPYLDGLDDIRMKKIKEFFDTAEVKAKEKPKPKPKPVAAPPKAAPGKRMVKKGPAGLKKHAPAAASSPVDETPASPPAIAKPAGRGPTSRLAGPKSGLAAPGGGLKLQKRLVGPGGARPPPSPRRASSPAFEEEPVAAPAPTPRSGLGGRGLTNRPLGRAPSAESAPTSMAPISSGFSALERAELEELRAEKEQYLRLTQMNEDLRSEKTKLLSQVHELQNQNAQLIEDHTRDVLSIKAKETQLIRARSDAETAEQSVQKLQRESERLKRELARTVRAASPPMSTPFGEIGEQIYNDGSLNGHSQHPEFRTSRFDSVPSINTTYMSRGRPYLSSPSEEKENGSVSSLSKAGSPPPYSHDGRDSSSRGSPNRGMNTQNQSSGESWKRAAEVTSQLKARIEQMKVYLTAILYYEV